MNDKTLTTPTENKTQTLVLRDANDEPFEVSWQVTPGQTSWMVKGTRIYEGGINIYFGAKPFKFAI